jgi:hypothetical protein
MKLHPDTFQYLSPSASQVETMGLLRDAATEYAKVLVKHVPDGPDKTYLLRKLREVAMWANIAITRESDGAPTIHWSSN